MNALIFKGTPRWQCSTTSLEVLFQTWKPLFVIGRLLTRTQRKFENNNMEGYRERTNKLQTKMAYMRDNHNTDFTTGIAMLEHLDAR